MDLLKRILCLILLSTLLLSVAAGCGNKKDDRESDGFMTSSVDSGDSVSMLKGEESAFDEEYVPDFVSVKDVDPDMSVTVVAPKGYTAEDVMAGTVLKNLSNPVLTDPEEKDLLEPDKLAVEGGNGTFTVACEGGFNKGEIYQIELTDSALSYDGEGNEVRLYNITVAGEETNNLRLAGDMKYLSASELSEEDAGNAMKYDGILRYDYQSGPLSAKSGTGSFTYAKDTYNPGDVIAIYEGDRPDDRDVDDTEQGIAYIRITEVKDSGDGRSEYVYEGAEPEDVLYVPDVIPVKGECGLGVGEEAEITLSASELEFTSDGEFAEMGLDENTVVEPGDFLAFYTGDAKNGEISAYAVINGITFTEGDGEEDTAEIDYTVTELEDLLASAEVYHRGTLTEDQIRDSYDEEAIKRGVVEDLTNNGYLAESTYNLAELAMETDEAKEIFEDSDLEDLTFFYGEDEEVSLSGKNFLAIAEGRAPNGVEVKGDPDVVISPNTVHFAGKTGYSMGVRVEAHAKYIITIRGSELAKAGLRITLTFFFETEVVLGYTFDSTSIWKTWLIFPYLYDYNVTGSCTCGLYVGVGFTAEATLFENNPTMDDIKNSAGIPWPEGVDKTAGAEKVKKLCEYIKDFGKKHESIFPQQTTGGGSLTEKYSAFIKTANKSWVDIINENIFDWNGAIDPWHVLAYRIKCDFIVSAQMNAAIGVGANYERSYRNTFSFMIFHHDDSTSKTDETDTSRFRADFYVFGALGIRAGLRLTVSAGLFDARLDSIGVEIEGGIYQRFWGFFYAGIEINDVGSDANKDMYYAGAILAETGGYYSFTFVAQAGDGAISYKKYIGGGEYPFLRLGTDTLVSDFAYDQGDEKVNFYGDYTGSDKKVIIPEAVFMMNAMSVKDGTVSSVSKKGKETKDLFEITFDDPNFSYVYEDNTNYVVRKDAPGGSGTVTMKVKWKGNSFQTLSRDLERTIKIEWIANKRTVKFLNKDGSTFYMISKPEGTALSANDFPKNEPTAYGYDFNGWVDGDGNVVEKLPDTMPDHDVTYRSTWSGSPVSVNVRYYVPFYRDTQGRMQYTFDGTDVIDGLFLNDDTVKDVTDALAEKHLLRTQPDYDYEGKEPYDGYRVNRSDSTLFAEHVKFDGSTTFSVYLELDTITVTYDNGDGTKSTREYLPGAHIDFPKLDRPGYTFKGWTDDDGNFVSADDPPVCDGTAKYTAVWEKDPPTLKVNCQVKVRSWGMNYYWNTVLSKVIVADGYEIAIDDILKDIEIEGYKFSPDNSAWRSGDTVTIAEDGSTVITLRFIGQ
ncbi:MAG: InlB B-repeat-containing protein [Clostridia bacterium]|nr:InlB B-repeat-containing protein [Clostridia bacterium]